MPMFRRLHISVFRCSDSQVANFLSFFSLPVFPPFLDSELVIDPDDERGCLVSFLPPSFSYGRVFVQSNVFL